MTKTQIAVSAVLATAGISVLVTQAQSQAALRTEIAALNAEESAMAALRAENRKLADTETEVEVLRRDDAEFKRLEQRVAETRRVQQEKARVARAAASLTTEAEIKAEVDRLNKEGNQLVVEYKALVERTRDPALTADARVLAQSAADAKLEAIKAKQRAIQEYIAARSGNPSAAFSANPPALNRTEVSGEVSDRKEVTMTLGLTDADYETALLAYENIARVKITRDASLTGLRGTADLTFGEAPRNKIMDQMRKELGRQWNIVLERAPDGSLIAKARTP